MVNPSNQCMFFELVRIANVSMAHESLNSRVKQSHGPCSLTKVVVVETFTVYWWNFCQQHLVVAPGHITALDSSKKCLYSKCTEMRTHNIAQLYKDSEALSESIAFTGVFPQPLSHHIPLAHAILDPLPGLGTRRVLQLVAMDFGWWMPYFWMFFFSN